MPIEIICKYWAYIYTLEGKKKFYYILNAGLRSENYKLFLPFIKMMYEGVKRKVFKPVTDQELYSGGVISNKELQNIQNILNDNSLNNNLPKVIYYLKAFKSFSKNKNKSEGFIRDSSKESTGMFFILTKDEDNNNNKNNNIEDEFISNADIQEFSRFKSEEEVLFFPFSSFEVLKIENGEIRGKKCVIIYLKYLGRYKKYIEKNKILISIENKLKLYDLKQDKNIDEIEIHSKKINDLIRINEITIFSSSNDKTIKIIKLIDNFSKLNEIDTIDLNSAEINQTIKLKKEEDLYASCSNDKTIRIWKYNQENNHSKLKNIINTYKEVLTLYELPNNNLICISKDEFLKFFELKEENYLCIKSLKGFKDPLHNCIFLLNEKTILVGIKKAIYIIDINKKQKIKRFLLNYSAHSIYYINGNIFLGLKNNLNSSLLFEYIIEKENDDMNLKCIEEEIYVLKFHLS